MEIRNNGVRLGLTPPVADWPWAVQFKAQGRRHRGEWYLQHLVNLFIPREVAHETVAELGELGNVQFKDCMFKYGFNWTKWSS